MKCNYEEFSGEIIKKVKLKYLAYLPEGYEKDKNKKWPLILFLHGMGERGEDLELVKRQGLPNIINELEYFPFILIAPQCPTNSMWYMEIDSLFELVKHVINQYNVDTSRIYLTGLSMGGFGTWHFAEAHPKLFAAIVPVCGGTVPKIGFPERIKVLKDVPVWAFHGAKDEIVPIEMSKELVDVLRQYNGNVKFTVYPDAGHDSWTETYRNKDLYAWLLEQKNDKFTLE